MLKLILAALAFTAVNSTGLSLRNYFYKHS